MESATNQQINEEYPDPAVNGTGVWQFRRHGITMNNWSFYDSVTGLIPFKLKGYNGKVSVYYGVNDDPIKVGFDSLPGITVRYQYEPWIPNHPCPH